MTKHEHGSFHLVFYSFRLTICNLIYFICALLVAIKYKMALQQTKPNRSKAIFYPKPKDVGECLVFVFFRI